jgi:multidrug efflux pump subunit AcrB
MDTGIANISFEISPNSNIEEMTSLVNRIEREILEEASVLSISTIIGSEPDSMSFSQGGSSVQTASMEIRLLPRNKRKEDIWSITNRWRQSFNRYPELISLTLSEYGATPNSSVKSPVNIIISGRDDIQLSFYADAIIKELDSLKGVVDLRRSWYMARKEYIISPKPLMLEEHNIRFRDIANFIRNSTSEVPAGNIRLESFRDIPVYIKLKDINSPQDVLGLNFYNNLPLRNLINVRQDLSKTLDTRQDLKNTIDLYAVNDIIPISIITRKIEDKIRPVTSNLPSDIKITLGGNVTEMQNTMGRVFSSLLIGLVLLYFLLVIMLKSFSHPLSIMSIIPFSLSGAFLGLLLFNKSVSMPAMMGIILLNGTIVNNAILIVTFINDARKDKKELMPAVKQAVDLRLRPILMTTASTVIGLSPLVFETAVGLERMSPLGIVAASGLIAGTFLTMIIVPVVYVLLEQIKNRL